MNTTSPTPARHRWLDDWRGARGPALRTLVSAITAEVEALEERTGARKRRRKEADQRRFEVAVEVVVSNLAHAVLVPPETGRLSILTGNATKSASRYDNKALGEPLRTLLGHLVELGLVEWGWSGKRLEASFLLTTEAFRAKVIEAGIALTDFGRLLGEETILLTHKARLSDGGGISTARQRVNYPDTSETIAMRGTVDELNAFLWEADISFDADGLEQVDTSDRTMRRHFVVKGEGPGTGSAISFDLCGRLYGGFWQNLKATRRGHIRIDGEPVAGLDYGQMAARLAYASVGATAPEGDIYAIEGLEKHRPAVKKALNTLLMDDHRRRSWPSELTDVEEGREADEVLPEGWTVARARAAIVARHHALEGCLGAGLGLKLMRTESEIMLAVLMELKARSIVGLGIHDGLLVQESRAEEVRLMMEEMAVGKVGATIPVSLERLYVDAPPLHL